MAPLPNRTRFALGLLVMLATKSIYSNAFYIRPLETKGSKCNVDPVNHGKGTLHIDTITNNYYGHIVDPPGLHQQYEEPEILEENYNKEYTVSTTGGDYRTQEIDAELDKYETAADKYPPQEPSADIHEDMKGHNKCEYKASAEEHDYEHQYNPAPKEQQYKPAANEQQYKPPPKEQQYKPAPKEQQYKPDDEEQQYKPAAQEQQYKPAGQQKQYKQAPREQQYKHAAPQNQYKQAVPKQQYQQDVQCQSYHETQQYNPTAELHHYKHATSPQNYRKNDEMDYYESHADGTLYKPNTQEQNYNPVNIYQNNPAPKVQHYQIIAQVHHCKPESNVYDNRDAPQQYQTDSLPPMMEEDSYRSGDDTEDSRIETYDSSETHACPSRQNAPEDPVKEPLNLDETISSVLAYLKTQITPEDGEDPLSALVRSLGKVLAGKTPEAVPQLAQNPDVKPVIDSPVNLVDGFMKTLTRDAEKPNILERSILDSDDMSDLEEQDLKLDPALFPGRLSDSVLPIDIVQQNLKVKQPLDINSTIKQLQAMLKKEKERLEKILAPIRGGTKNRL